MGGFPFLAANLKVKDAAVAQELALPGFRLFERRGLRVGVVGLTSPKTVGTVMAGRAEGLELAGYEETLARRNGGRNLPRNPPWPGGRLLGADIDRGSSLTRSGGCPPLTTLCAAPRGRRSFFHLPFSLPITSR